jgi:hypothetical protein
LPAPSNPSNRHAAVFLTSKEVRFDFGNVVSQEVSDTLFDRWTIPVSSQAVVRGVGRRQLFAAFSGKGRNSKRGSRTSAAHLGAEDYTVPDKVTRSTLKQYRDSSAVTELMQYEGRGHSLTIDESRKDVAKRRSGLAEEQIASEAAGLVFYAFEEASWILALRENVPL